ncbi:MAG TPA: hypothetical protein VFW11_08260 [Cyclobacteriaceae bacterium]|nr:hypothetical protein [Cyclobacteriaceae bacterium]
MKMRITYRELSILAGIMVALIVVLILWIGHAAESGIIVSSTSNVIFEDQFNPGPLSNFLSSFLSKASLY